MKKEIIKQLNNINEVTDQKTVFELKEKISNLNIYDKDNHYIFELAKEKGIN